MSKRFLTGASFAGNITLGDDEKAIFGAGSDLTIYHKNPNQDRIESTSSFLILEASNVILRNNGGTEDYAKFLGNGAVELYHDNSKKFETTSGGVTVTGTIDSGTITSTGIVKAATTFQSTSGSMLFFVPNVGQALEIAQNTGNATFAGQITTTKNQITTDIGTTSAIRLKPAATTNSGGKSSIFLGTSTADNYGISLRGARNSGSGTPTFELATHNNSNNGTLALSIDNSQNATFSGDIMPSAENAHNIGSASVRWEDLYVDDGFIRNAYIDTKIIHAGDDDNFIEFGTDTISISKPATFAGDIDLTAGQLELRGDVALDHDGSSLYVKAPASIFLFPGNANKGNINTAGLLTVTSLSTGAATFAGDVSLGDNKNLDFGAATDFRIVHNSTTNVNHISSKLDRQLSLNANNVFITNQANTESMARFIADAEVKLYYDNVQKFQTTSTGIEVSGTSSTFAGAVNAGSFVKSGGTSSQYLMADGSVTTSSFNGGTITNNLTISNSSPALNLTDTDNSSNIAFSSVGGALIVNSASDQVYQIGGAEKMRLNSSGNVGIGTTSPGSRRLNVVTSDSGNDVGFESTIARTSGSNYGIRGLANGSGATTNIGAFFEASGASTNTALWSYNGRVLLATQNTTDYVGIGTASPSHKLHIDSNGSSNSVIRIDADDNRGASRYALDIVDDDTNSRGSVRISTTSGPSLIATGSVGIGTTSPAFPLTVAGPSGTEVTVARFVKGNYADSGGHTTIVGLGVESTATWTKAAIAFERTGGYDTGKIHFLQEDTVDNSTADLSDSVMTIDKTGNVGIGTTSPSDLLTVTNSGTGDAALRLQTTTGGDPTIYFNSSAANRSGLIRYQDNGTNVGRIEYVHNGDKLQFQAGSATGQILELTNSTATFAGAVKAYGNSDTTPAFEIYSDANHGMRILHRGTDGDFSFERRLSGTNTEFLRVSRANGNATFQENLTAKKLTSTDGVLDLDDNGNADGVINARASLTINIDSDANSTAEVFRINSNTTSANTNNLFNIKENGKVGIGTANAQNAELVIKSGSNVDLELFSEASGTAWQSFNRTTSAWGYLRFLAGGGEQMRVHTNGNVGIGTTSPGAKLHVAGNSQLGGNLHVATDGSFNTSASYTFRDGVFINNPNSTSAVVSNSVMSLGASSGNPAFTSLVTTGAIGIGTSSPSKRLHVYNTASADVALFESTQAFSTLAFKSSTNTDTAVFGIDGGGNAYIENKKSTHPILFTTNSSERMRIDSSGNVGIGKTTSLGGHGLSIKKVSNQQLGCYYNETNFAAFGARSSGDVQIYGYNGSSYKNILLGVDGSATGGNVGIGTTSPDAKLHIQGGSSDQKVLEISTAQSDGPYTAYKNTSSGTTTLGFIGNSQGIMNSGNTNFGIRANNDLTFSSGGATERMRITSGGDLCVGVTSALGRIHMHNSGTSYFHISNDTTGSGAGSGTDIGIFTGQSDLQINNREAASVIISTSDTPRLTINSSGNSTFSGNVVINGSGSSGNAFNVTRGSDGSTALRVQNTGEVVTQANYFYASGPGVSMYVQNTAVFRGSIVNDGGNVTIGDDLVITGNVGIGTTSFAADSILTIGTAASTGLTLLSVSNSGESFINFADTADVNAGRIYYGHSDNAMRFRTNDALRMIINSSGKVGINYTTAPYRLSVKEDGTAATNIGVYALVNGAGTNNYAFYADANSGTSTNFGVYSNSGNNAFLGSVGIGMDSPVDKLEITGGYLKFNGGDYGLKGSASLSYNATSDHYFQSGGSTKVTFKADGKVGIGNTNPSQKLHVTGSILASSDVVAFSDIKLKENIKTLDGSKVYNMRGVSFTRKDTGKDSSGVIAQEIQKIAPELVTDNDGTLSVAYGNLTGYLIEAVKELKAEIEELKKHKCDCKE